MLELVLGNGRVSSIPPGADPAVVAGLAAALGCTPRASAFLIGAAVLRRHLRAM